MTLQNTLNTFVDGEAMIMRTCTKELDFKLPLVNNVCQPENDGFGFLCMCGRSSCNSATSIASHGRIIDGGLLFAVWYMTNLFFKYLFSL